MPQRKPSPRHALWAKSDLGGAAGSHLPLLLHMLDVAAVAGAVWDRVLTGAVRERVAVGLGLDAAQARGWLVWLAALHDIGKCSNAFQQKSAARRSALLDAGVSLAQLDPGHDVPHGAISARVLEAELRRRGMRRDVAKALAVVVGGHHGVLPSAQAVQRAGAGGQAGDGRWDELRADLIDAVEEVIEGGVTGPLGLPSRAEPGALIALGGFVSVVDWIGSDADRFPLLEPGDAPPSAAARHADSTTTARDLVAQMGWADRGLATPRRAPTLDEVVGHAPRDVQRQVARLLADSAGPCLLLVETETGSGKSEAAMWAIAHGLAHGATGAYVALPTQATANQMHRRVRGALARVLDLDPRAVGLLHGTAQLAVDEELLDGRAPAVAPRDVHDGEPDTAAREWFARRKRGLLSPFAVGTVDQALLGVLNVRHFFVRLWGLAGAVVVIDEAHAYDAYTSRLLSALVEWCAACGSTVVLLSATLAEGQRRQLLDAYAAGAGWEIDPAPRPAYPRVTLLDADAERGRSVETVRAVDRREIALAWSDAAADPHRLAAELLEATEDGGCVALVCNTVALAQRRFRALREIASDDVALVLFHARMRHCERAAIEAQLADMFGPPHASASRPRRAVVIATQVVEQSLDVDFDTIWTDFAPVDLLVQRAGRVMRHVRPGDDGAGLRGGRRITLLVPSCDDPTELLGSERTRVYHDAILLRTRAVLADRPAIVEPDDLDALVDGVYDDTRVPACDSRLAAAIAQADPSAEEREAKLSTVAGLGMIARPGTPDLVANLRHDLRPDRDDLRYGTRYDELPSVSAVVLRPGELEHLLGRRPDTDAARELLRRSVRLPLDGGGTEPPIEWQKSTFLRDYILVQLDRDGRGAVGGRAIRWDETLGVQTTEDRE